MLNTRNEKYIENIEVGDILENGAKITAKIKVSAKGLTMYNLNGITISESHIVKFNDKWIPIREHPNAVKIYNYNESYLYCLNTSTKTIILNNTIFTDWDEIYDEKLDTIMKVLINNNDDCEKVLENIHKYLDDGFLANDLVLLDGEYKEIKNVKIGDKTKSGDIVYGLVEIETNDLKTYLGKIKPDKIYHLLTTNNKIIVNNKEVNDYNGYIDYICIKNII